MRGSFAWHANSIIMNIIFKFRVLKSFHGFGLICTHSSLTNTRVSPNQTFILFRTRNSRAKLTTQQSPPWSQLLVKAAYKFPVKFCLCNWPVSSLRFRVTNAEPQVSRLRSEGGVSPPHMKTLTDTSPSNFAIVAKDLKISRTEL